MYGSICAGHVLNFRAKLPRTGAHLTLVLRAWAQVLLPDATSARCKGRHAAFRALAGSLKWQRIMWRCWRDHVPYNDLKYVQSLKRDNNELYSRIIAFHSAPTGE